jgi:hypothetical protein
MARTSDNVFGRATKLQLDFKSTCHRVFVVFIMPHLNSSNHHVSIRPGAAAVAPPLRWHRYPGSPPSTLFFSLPLLSHADLRTLTMKSSAIRPKKTLPNSVSAQSTRSDFSKRLSVQQQHLLVALLQLEAVLHPLPPPCLPCPSPPLRLPHRNRSTRRARWNRRT